MQQNHSIVLNRQDLWPVPLWTMAYPLAEQHKDQMIATIDQLRRQHPGGADGRSNPVGWQSPKLLQTLPIFKPLIHMGIDALLNPISAHMNWNLKGAKINVESWANVNPPGSPNQIHAHAGALLSAAYYVHFPEDGGGIRFYNPRKIFQHDDQPPRADLGRQHTDSVIYRVQPRSGLLVLFPGYLAHDVEVNRSSEVRYAISFNVHAEPGDR